MTSNRITKKLNKLAKNKTSKKCKLEKRISKKRVKRSKEKKSRKMRGGGALALRQAQQLDGVSVKHLAEQFGEVVNRQPHKQAGVYAQAFPPRNKLVAASNLTPNGNGNKQVITNSIAGNHNNINQGNEEEPASGLNEVIELSEREKTQVNQPTTNHAYVPMGKGLGKKVELGPYNNSPPEQPQTEDELKLFHDVGAKFIKLLEVLGVNPTAVLDIQTALNNVSSLSAEEFSKLQEKLKQLIDKYQPLYAEMNEEKVRVYENLPPQLPERNQKKTTGNSCSNKSKKDCEESPECELVKTKTRGRFGLSKKTSTCVRKETITPQIYEQPVPNPELNQTPGESDPEPAYDDADIDPRARYNTKYVAPANLGGQK